MVATFPTVDAAARAVVAVRRTLRPSMLELMDRASINAVEDHRPMGSTGPRARCSSPSPTPRAPPAAPRSRLMRAACAAAGATEVFVTDDPDEGELFVEARRIAFPAIEARGSLLLEDVGVPDPAAPRPARRRSPRSRRRTTWRSRWSRTPATATPTRSSCTTAGDPDAEKRAREAFAEVMARAIALGGTITGEHGVGRAKKAALPAQLGPDVMALTRRVKDALDPDGILNPGAVL